MAYELHGLVTLDEAAQEGAQVLGGVTVSRLQQGYSLLPGPTAGRPHDELPTGWPFGHLTSRWREAAIALSHTAAIAYVECEFHGGAGWQFAVVWEAGQTVLGPLGGDKVTAAGYHRPASQWPINAALRRLGVRTAGGLDEFDHLGLGRHRRTGRWIGTR